jgi:UDP-glucose 4-epimerase
LLCKLPYSSESASAKGGELAASAPQYREVRSDFEQGLVDEQGVKAVKYLVTGGAGFIGSHLSDALLARGEQVIALDNLSTGSEANVAQNLANASFQFRPGSITDQILVDELVEQADIVVHLAAAVGVKLILERPLEALITNIKGTEVVIEACAVRGRKLLIASTSEIYGKNVDGPLKEDADRILGSPFKARWSYSTAKAVDEILAHAYWRERGMPSIVARLFNCVGPRQTGTYGMVVPGLIRQALAGIDLTVYGDGEQRRCFCHVRDTVRGLIGLLDEPAAIGDVFNIGTAEEVTINELARLVVELTGSKSKIVHVSYDEAYEKGFEDMQRRIPDTGKIEGLIGWRATVPLRETIIEIVASVDAEAPPSQL